MRKQIILNPVPAAQDDSDLWPPDTEARGQQRPAGKASALTVLDALRRRP